MTMEGYMSAIEIPNKSSFKIGEVAELLSLEAYVLRYWETEFDQLKPRKTRTGQRAYARGDIEILLRIKALLYDDMYTIAGARKQLDGGARRPSESDSAENSRMLSELTSLRSRARELEMANQSLDGEVETLRARVSELEYIDQSIVFFPSAVNAEVDELNSKIAELEDENSLLQGRLGHRDQSRRHSLALVRRELETMSRLAVG
jgi:DNA-binding transcriptional MerR regulator